MTQLMMSREEALTALQTLGSPSVKSENYRYTSLKGVSWDAPPVASGVQENLPALPELFRNDFFALANQAYAPACQKITAQGLVALSYEGLKSQQPYYYRAQITVPKNTQAQIVDLIVGDPALFNALIVFEVEAGATLSYTQLQNLGPASVAFLRHQVILHQDAKVEWTMAARGAFKYQYRLESECKGTGSDMKILSATRGSESQHFDFWTTTTHQASHTTSSMDHWAVMGDKARAVFNGKISIPHTATHTDAYQKNRNLLLSPQAVIDALPKLEIATDEVKCAHGASIAPVSDEQMYYLQSRGITRAEAESMIVDGFTEPALQKIKDLTLRNLVRETMIGHASQETEVWS